MEVRCVDDEEYRRDDPQREFDQGWDGVPARTRFGRSFNEGTWLLTVGRHFDGGLWIKVATQTPMSEFLNGTTHSLPTS